MPHPSGISTVWNNEEQATSFALQLARVVVPQSFHQPTRRHRQVVGEERHVAVRQEGAEQHVHDAIVIVVALDPSIPLDCKGV
jgi:hypothetical protein